MNIRIPKLSLPLLVLLGLACLVSPFRLHAQFVTLSGTSSYSGLNDFEFRTDGTLIAKGSLNTGNALATTDTGAFFLWYPKQAALRAGLFTSSQLTQTTSGDLIGSYSVALGYETIASNSYSTASGKLTVASGIASTAIGYGSAASGDYSISLGNTDTASGDYSTCLGSLNTASGNYSLAFGLGNTASGLYTTTFGHQTTAEGYYATAFGYIVDAYAHNSTVIGRYNLGSAICYDTTTTATSSQSNWYPSDPLFEIGNGTGTVHSDALIVYKSGATTVNGPLTANAGVLTTPASITSTDIPMFGR